MGDKLSVRFVGSVVLAMPGSLTKPSKNCLQSCKAAPLKEIIVHPSQITAYVAGVAVEYLWVLLLVGHGVIGIYE